jgi:inner membrane transporter RhtA
METRQEAAPRTGPARNIFPVGVALAAMVAVQAGAALAKSLFAHVGAQGAVTLRVVLATAILVVFQRPWRSALSWREVRIILPYGLTLGVMNLCFYLALRTIPLGVAVALEFTGPLAVAVIASRRPLDLLWVALAVTGIVLMYAPSATGRIDPQGALLALAAGGCWGLYIVFGKRISGLGAARAVTFGMIVAALVVLPFGIAAAGARLFDVTLLPLALGVALLSSALPYTMEMYVLARLPHRTFGILMSVEPAIAALFGLVMLDERLSLAQCAAIACVIAASLGSVAGLGRAGDAPLPP